MPPRDYTARDFLTLRNRGASLMRSAFPGWTYDPADFGTMLLELGAFYADAMDYYLDAAARETRFGTARRRESIIMLAKLVGYRARGTLAARATLLVSLASPPVADFRLETGAVVRTLSQPVVSFELVEPAVIPAGADPPETEVVVENSVTRGESFQSTDEPGQAFDLPSAPYIDASASVIAADGVYEEVDTLVLSTPDDRHFMVDVDADGRATIIFGDGVAGVIPSGTISCAYKSGGGVAGNVGALQIIDAGGPVLDTGGNAVVLSITNPEAAAGGADLESAGQLKATVPETIRSPRTTVSFDDYVAHAQSVAGVARALPLSSDQEVGIPENTVFLYVVPDGGGDPGDLLLSSVLEAVTITWPKPLTQRVDVRGAVYLTVNIHARVFRSAGFGQAETRANIDAALAARFALYLDDGSPNPDVDFGYNIKNVFGDPAGEIAWSVMLRAVLTTEGVRKIGDGDSDFLLNGASDDLPITGKEFPRLGVVTLVDGDTGDLF